MCSQAAQACSEALLWVRDRRMNRVPDHVATLYQNVAQGTGAGGRARGVEGEVDCFGHPWLDWSISHSELGLSKGKSGQDSGTKDTHCSF